MPRGEQPIEAADSELGRFAADLRRLRDKAGKPSYRELATRAHYSAATLSDAAGGRKLPTLAVTRAYVKACGGDPDEWEARWRAIAAPPDQTGQSPYVGLKAFQEEDADRFFGREKLTAKLVDLVAKRRLVGVFGASGSGKSSLLRAGLVPRLANALVLTPGPRPLEESAVRLAQLTGGSAVAIRAELADPAALGLRAKQHDVVLVVDQFEEVFTLCDQEQRDWFVEALVQAPRVVIGVRADFYGHIGRHPELVEALEGAQILVGPMTTDELRRAITEPARHVGATVETALVTRLVADVAGQAAALPLVQHALAETWRRRRGMTLSLTGYEEAGGVEHAIARTAETVYNDLTEDQQTAAKRIFLRLIALGEGTEDTKRRAAREDLDDDVLDRLAAARLVSLGEHDVELSHEALIRSWPRLRDWIAEDRAALRVHHQLTEAAAAWDGTDPDVLYRGVRLAQARDLDPGSLTSREREFLDAAAELERSAQAAARRGARRLKVLVAVLAVVVVVMGVAVGYAVQTAKEVTRQRNDALAGRAVTEVMRLIPIDPVAAAKVALAAYAVSPGQATRDALLTASAAERRWWGLGAPEAKDGDLTFGSNKPFFIRTTTGQPASVWSWSTSTPGPAHSVAFGEQVDKVLLSSDDTRAFAFERSGEVGIWDFHAPENPKKIGALPRAPKTLTVSHDGSIVAGTIPHPDPDVPGLRAFVWDLKDDPSRPREVPLREKYMFGVVAAPSKNKVVLLRRDTVSLKLVAEFWDVGGAEAVPGVRVPVAENVLEVAVDPDGRFLAVLAEKTAVEIWDVAGPRQVKWATVPVVPSGRPTLAFNRFGTQLAVQNAAAVDIWDISAQDQPVQLGAFGGFRGNIHGLRRFGSEEIFAVVDTGPTLWRLDTDVAKVRKTLCGDRNRDLSDEEWRRYFRDVPRSPVC